MPRTEVEVTKQTHPKGTHRTAGWSYKDWEGIVYPANKPKGFDPAAYLAQYFDTIEINSTFYRPPSPEVVRKWSNRVRDNPNFRFTAKLWRGFTHERNASVDDEREFRDGIAPLAEDGRLGALLLQFPWSFRNTSANRTYLLQLQQRFREFPLVLEVRHATWNDEAVLQILGELGIGLCNIDQPLFSDSIHPSAHSTSPVGYVRLHGRNYKQWFTENAKTGDRYNYLYSPDELEPWVARIKEVAKQAKETYAVTNNHLNGQAAVNALEIAAYILRRIRPSSGTACGSLPQAERDRCAGALGLNSSDLGCIRETKSFECPVVKFVPLKTRTTPCGQRNYSLLGYSGRLG